MSDQREPWWVHHPDHMKGWEAFGVTGGAPIVRRLGRVDIVQGKATTEEHPGTTPWGSGEVKLGVAGIEYSTHADHPEGAYLYVCGTTEEDVREGWHRANTAWESVREALWPKSRMRS